MYPVPAPPSSSLPEEEKEHHEKNPVLKKVMDKVKKMKKAIRKKTPGYVNGGDNDDHPQDGDLDEGDEEYEEDEEIKEDPAVHDVPKYESPAIGATTGAKENSVGGGEGVGLRLTTEKFVGDLDPPSAEPKTNISQGGEREGAEGVGDGLGMINEESVEDSGVRRTEGETNFGIEQSRGFPLYESSPATGAKTGVTDISGGGGEGAERVNDGMDDAEMNTRNEQSQDSPFNMSGGLEGAKGVGHFAKDPASLRADDVTDTRNEQTQVYESSATDAKTGANELLGVESATGVDDGSGLITKDFVENPATPRTNDETDTKIEQSQVHLSPTAGGARTGVNEMSGGVEAEGDGLGIIPMDLVEDPAEGGEVVEAAPELCRSLEAMAISPQSDKGETELSKDKNNSYAGMVSSAASKVYGIAADAGTAVISRVKPDSGKEGGGDVGGKQGKGISIKDYITDKLTPGEDERALSELITEGRQSKKNAAVEVPPPEKTSYEEGGRGVGVVGKIRDTITSFLGGGESSPKSPATEARRKVAEDDNDFLRRTPEAISHEKRSSEELPSSYNRG